SQRAAQVPETLPSFQRVVTWVVVASRAARSRREGCFELVSDSDSPKPAEPPAASSTWGPTLSWHSTGHLHSGQFPDMDYLPDRMLFFPTSSVSGEDFHPLRLRGILRRCSHQFASGVCGRSDSMQL